jgi:hypothetical protein
MVPKAEIDTATLFSAPLLGLIWLDSAICEQPRICRAHPFVPRGSLRA